MIASRFCKKQYNKRLHGRISDVFTEVLSGAYFSKSTAESA